MKKIALLILTVCFVWLSIQAQNEPVNPFEKYGYTPKIATLSKGKYVEFHDQDTLVQIGGAVLNTVTMKIMGFVEYDTTYNEYNVSPEVISRWLSPDPLTDEFPSWSPYNYVENNPIRMVDPTGMAPEDPTVFASETGEVLVDIKDGSDKTFIVEDKNRDAFAKEISTKIIENAPSLKDADKNAEIGEKYGFNIKNSIEGFGFGAFKGYDENSIKFKSGFDIGYDPELKKVAYYSHGFDKGGGTFFFGQAKGKKFKEEGKINPFNPELKSDKPRITIN